MPTPPITDDSWLDRARADFKVFLAMLWAHLSLPAPTPAQYAFADYLQHGPKRRGLLCFRGVGKSWVTGAFVMWRLWLDPQRKMLIISASADRATAFSTFVKRVIAEWWVLAELRPRKGQRDSVENFDVGPALAAQAPSVKSVGITGQFTGTRAHDVILDDVEVPKNSETVLMREKLSERVKEAAALLVPDTEDTTITYLGTPQTEDTLYVALPERGYTIRIWPARYPDEALIEQYRKMGAEIFPQLEGGPVGEPTDPERFDEMDLQTRELEYGKTGFAMQFMLNPALSDAERYPLKLRDLIVMPLDADLAPNKVVWSSDAGLVADDLPCVGMSGDRWFRRLVVNKDADGWSPYSGTVMAVDPSGRGPDETTYAIVSFLNGQLFLMDWGGYTGDGYSRAVLLKLAYKAKKWNVKAFAIESNFGDGMFTALFNPIMQEICGYGVGAAEDVEVRHNTQKEVRIVDSLGPVMGQHKLIVNESAVRDDYTNCPTEPSGFTRRGFWQMTRLTRDRGCLKHDDRLDALAMAVQYWTDRMGVDVDKAVERRKSAALKEEWNRWKREGLTPGRPGRSLRRGQRSAMAKRAGLRG